MGGRRGSRACGGRVDTMRSIGREFSVVVAEFVLTAEIGDGLRKVDVWCSGVLFDPRVLGGACEQNIMVQCRFVLHGCCTP